MADRYLLESGAPDGYQLEDGTGVLILDSSDDFNRANNADLGANWDVQTGLSSWKIAANAAEPSSHGADCAENWNANTPADDQYSQGKVTVAGTGGQTGIGVAVRMATAAKTSYLAVANKAASNNIEIGKWVAGAYTQLGQRTTTWVDGDVLRLEVAGTTLKVYKNGSQLGADLTDSSITSGRVGLLINSTVNSGFVDDWEGGSLAGAAAQQADPKAIQSEEVVSSPARIDLQTTPAAIASAEEFGKAGVEFRPSPLGIETAEKFGNALAEFQPNPAAINSAEAFGNTRLDQEVSADEILSDEAFGNVAAQFSSNPPGIESGEVVSSPARIDLEVTARGIESVEAFGNTRLDQALAFIGISSTEALGAVETFLSVNIFPIGINSDESVGISRLDQALVLAGIPSNETLGITRLDQSVVAAAIGSSEQSGNASFSFSIAPNGIASSETVSGVQQLNQAVAPSSLDLLEAFGVTQLNRELAAIGISSTEALGNSSTNQSVGINPNSIQSEQVLGNIAVSPQQYPSNRTGFSIYGWRRHR